MVQDHKALFLTEDKNFVDTLFWQKKYCYGVVLIRLDDVVSSVKGKILADVIERYATDFSDSIVAVTSRTVRIRKFV